MKIQGKLAIITGASRGIGAAAAKALAQSGAKVVLTARTQSDLEKVAEEIRKSGGEAHVFACDLGNLESVGEMTGKVKAEVGIPDIIINNAGLGQWKNLEDTSPEEALLMTQLPYLAAVYVTRGFLPEMIKRGSGHILNVNSPASMIGIPGSVTYSAARWALRGFSKVLHIDLKPRGIGVTNFVAGKVSSNYFNANPESEERVPGISRIIGTMTPETTAKHIVTAIRKNKKNSYRPFMLWLIKQNLDLTPWLVQWLTTLTGYRKK